MTQINNFSDYWRYVQRQAQIGLDELKQEIEDTDQEYERHSAINDVAEEAVEWGSLVNNHARSIVYHNDNGFGGAGHRRYIEHREDQNDPLMMLRCLAQAAYYNDLVDVLETIFKCRDSLGEAIILLDNVLLSERVTASYEYERLASGETHHFKLTHLGENEWRLTNPNIDTFEIISPDVHLEQSDGEIPVKDLSIWLDNICARLLREDEQ